MNNNYKVGNYFLDDYQMKLLKTTNNALVIAGAGTGKTLTILGKINYLVEFENILPKEILVISFTNASVDDIKSKIKYECDILTFHKLAMKILDTSYTNYSLANQNLLKFTINEYLTTCNKNEQNTILKFIKVDMNYKVFLKSKHFESLCKMIESYINLFKANNYNYKNIISYKYSKIEKQMLIIIFKIYKEYNIEKQSSMKIDYDDLIINATKQVKHSKLYYSYIIIDEFQDTSFIRLNLVRELVKKNNSKIIVVGDDWQSIYRFSGCNLQLFLNFSSYFKEVNQIKLVNTYRNSQELIKIASCFISKNSMQIRKNLSSNKHTQNPIILVPYKKEIAILKRVLEQILLSSTDVMIISRNKKDIYDYIDNEYEVDIKNNTVFFKNAKIKYYTIHKSKGLEAEFVIVLNCNNNKLGFPNKIENNKIIEKLIKTHEIEFAEERRLFYVAITRCKNQVYLLYEKKNPSIFIKEIKKIIKTILHRIYYFK